MNCSSWLFLQGLGFGLGLVWVFFGFAFAGGGRWGGREEIKRLGKETQRLEDLKSRDRKTETEQAHSLSFLCTFFSIVKGMQA